MKKYFKIFLFACFISLLIGLSLYYIMPIYMQDKGFEIKKLLRLKQAPNITRTRYHRNLNYYFSIGLLPDEIKRNLSLSNNKDTFILKCNYFKKIELDSNKMNYSNIETRLDNLKFIGFYLENCYSFWEDDSARFI